MKAHQHCTHLHTLTEAQQHQRNVAASILSSKKTQTHTQIQPFNGPLSETTWVGWYQKKQSPIHTHHESQTSFINFLQLLQSIASSLFNYVLDSPFPQLSSGPLWSSSWSGTLYFILHTLLHPIVIFFSQHTPIPLQLVLL